MAKIKFRRDTEANWTSVNPILTLGEPGYDTTNNKIKIGNGTSTWTTLGYLINEAASGYSLNSSTYSVILEGTTGTVSVPNTIISQGFQLNLAGSQSSYDIGRYLIVRDGDVASHLHLDTPDNSLYDIILGDDSKFVRVDHTGTVVIGTNGVSSYSWTFGTDGNLTLPGGNTTIGNLFGSDAIISAPNTAFGVLSQGSTGFGGLQWSDTVVEPLNVAGIVVNSPYAASTGSVQIYTGVIGIPQQYAWTFGTDGNLTLPAGGGITFDSSATSIITGVTNIVFADGSTQTTAYPKLGSVILTTSTNLTTASHANILIEIDSSSPVTLTLPASAPVGTKFFGLNRGAGLVSITLNGGGAVTGNALLPATIDQYSAFEVWSSSVGFYRVA